MSVPVFFTTCALAFHACFAYKVDNTNPVKDRRMAKKKLVPFRIEEDWLQDLYALAGTYGVSPDDVIRRALPDAPVVRLFFQCKSYLTELRWDEVAAVGREAIREHLRTTYMEGLKQHLRRLGVSINASSDEVEAAKKNALKAMQADTARPLIFQIPKAQEDSVYLGYLYDAWTRANANEPGYAIAEVDVDASASARVDNPRLPQRVWAVLKNDTIV
jgi:hypothetical protein